MTAPRIGEHGLSLAEFWRQFVTVDQGGRLVRPSPHREQARVIEASAVIDEHGNRQYREVFLHWAKKCAKSFTAATIAIHHLVADPFEHVDRLVAIASFDEDQSRIIYGQGKQIVERDRYLVGKVKVGRTEMVFKEKVRDPNTGGTFTREHVLRALPRDLKGSHGENWSLVIRDEVWTEPDHAFSEALIISPTRANGLTVYCSYFAPRTMMRTGTPFYDVLKRAEDGDPRLFYSYIGGTGADAPQKVAPWVTDEWIAQQEKILAASPSRFRRVVLNIPAGADDGLITAAELRDSLVTSAEPEERAPGSTYWMAVDLGVTFDWTCVLVGHLDHKHRLVLDVVRTWRGSHQQPVSLIEVQQEIIELHRRFRCELVRLDQWQARQMVEQLERARVPAFIVTIDGPTTDRWITQLKSAFTRRLVQIPDRCTDVIEQLESVQAVEAGRRRDLLKFQPGTTSGNDASAHDDIAFALAMLVDMAWPNVGKIGMPESFRACWRVGNIKDFKAGDCFLCAPDAQGFMPPGNSDPVCKECVGWQFIRQAYKEHVDSGGEQIGYRAFRNRVGDNEFTGRVKQQRWEQWYV